MTDPTPTTNEQIALELGWTRYGITSAWNDPCGGLHEHPPDFEHDWAHAGPLLEELTSDDNAVGDLVHYGFAPDWGMSREVKHETVTVRADTATQAIARAWLAWKKEESGE